MGVFIILGGGLLIVGGFSVEQDVGFLLMSLFTVFPPTRNAVSRFFLEYLLILF
jgi:UPF0716 family protein affecting phage T7 exclusion